MDETGEEPNNEFRDILGPAGTSTLLSREPCKKEPRSLQEASGGQLTYFTLLPKTVQLFERQTQLLRN